MKVKDLSRFIIDGMDINDYPDFCDAYISQAWDWDGNELTEEQLEELNKTDYEGVCNAVQIYIPDFLAGDE